MGCDSMCTSSCVMDNLIAASGPPSRLYCTCLSFVDGGCDGGGDNVTILTY